MSFKLKTILGIALIEIVLLTVLIASVLNFIYSSNKKQINSYASTTIRLFLNATKSAVLASDLASLDSFGKDIVRNPEIVYVKIISHDITLSEYGSSQYLGIDRPIDLNLSEVNDGIYDITSTINEGGIKYGEIKMGLSIAQFDGVFHDTQKWSVMIATLEVALVMIFSFFLGTYLTSQLRQLKIASQIISEKGPGYQVKVSGSDEIANFARSFNDMSLNLKESYDQLKQNLVIQEEVNKNLGISQKKSEEANQARKETMKKLALEIEIRTRAEDALQQSYAEIELRVENRTEELNKARLDYQNTASDLTQLMDTANAMILSIDRSGNINNWNQTATNLLGYAKKDVMGKNLLNMFIRDEDKAQVRIILDKALEGEITSHYEISFYTQSKECICTLLNLASRIDADGKIIGVICVGQDISDRKQAEISLLQSSKLASLGEMATGVAHELNQPLNVIRMASGNIRRKIGKESLNEHYLTEKLERIESQTKRAAAIIDHMRMFGRQASDTLVELDPREVVHSVLGLVGEQLRLANIDIKIELPDTCPLIMGKEIQLEQVLINLLINAKDALQSVQVSKDKRIIIRIDAGVAEWVGIIVEDTGGGVDEKLLDRIFEPFFTTKEVGKGTGLGLAISYGIISDMGGLMSVQNSNLGARFDISLPANINPRNQI